MVLDYYQPTPMADMSLSDSRRLWQLLPGYSLAQAEVNKFLSAEDARLNMIYKENWLPKPVATGVRLSANIHYKVVIFCPQTSSIVYHYQWMLTKFESSCAKLDGYCFISTRGTSIFHQSRYQQHFSSITASVQLSPCVGSCLPPCVGSHSQATVYSV